MPTPASHRFRRFEVLPTERKLLVDGRSAVVGGRAFDLLLSLIERRERMVTKDELLDLVWPDVAVEPNNLAVQIASLRKLLGPDAIATIPGRGYRFSVALDELPRQGPTTTPAMPLAPKLKTNLPDAPPPLIGRADESAALAALVDRHALVTITGAGGIGKSRLAQHLLHQRRDAYAHGVCWIELAAVTEPSALPGALAAALGLQLGGGEPAAALRSALGPLAMLIVLDNAEHLLEEVASLVAMLGDSAPMLRVVVTSQAPLRLPREQVYRLDGLALPPSPTPAAQALGFGAVALFVDRARAADARFVFDDANASAVVDLCRRLDGLALAIELAAARAPVLGATRIIESLAERLQLLTGGKRGAPARQQTLRAALEWSHGLLGAHERIVFRRLAVIAGSASLELIQHIAADDEPAADGTQAPLDRWAVVDALSRLIDRSMVAISQEGDDRERPRYRLLDSPRAYAEERLREAGERERMAERHARAVGHLLEAAWEERWSGLVGGDAWRRRIAADLDNARIALSWAVARDDRPLVLMMAPVLLMRGLAERSHTERAALAETLDRMLATEPPAASQLRSRAMLICFWQNREPQQRLAEARGAAQLARDANDRFMLYVLTSIVAQIAHRLGDSALVAASISELHAIENPAWPAARLYWGAEACATCASGVASVPLWRKAFALADAAGVSVYTTRSNLIDIQLAAGDVPGAVASGHALLEMLEQTRDEFALVIARVNLTAALLAQGDVGAAGRVAKAGWAQAIGFGWHAFYADYLSLMAALEGRWRVAARLAGYAEATYARLNSARWPNEARAVERATSLAQSALGPAEFERLMAEGALLRDEQIAGIAFGTEADS